jgi:probable rRNA maturation factor
MNENFSIKNTTKGKLPSLPFASIKKLILANDYDLSLVFIGEKRSRNLNKKYRNKDKPTNILSFPLDKKNGEIFINLKTAKKDAPKFKKGYNEFIKILFIHGVLHLKGMEHGKKMEAEEERILKKF